MRKITKTVLILALVMLAISGPIYQGSSVDAATTNPPAGAAGNQLIVLPIQTISAATTAIRKFKAPWPFRIVHMSAVGQYVGGTVTIDLANQGGTSLLTSAMTLSTAVTDATLTATTANLNIVDETTIQLNTANTGTAANVTVLLGIKRL